ncbi:MAG: RNA methyltransferase [Firmicutes bacterium]|nr:RNA methyltransferase [Candidatus Colimorpha enterica]
MHILYKIYNVEKEDAKPKLILSSLRDPGNVGTVIRTANAFGIGELILSDDCADIYNPRTVRAAMGALFRQRISVVSDLCQCVENLKASGRKVYAAMLDRDAVSLSSLHCDAGTCFIVGNEGHGISEEVLAASSGSVFIPMEKDTESLNAATAASVFMWKLYSELN